MPLRPTVAPLALIGNHGQWLCVEHATQPETTTYLDIFWMLGMLGLLVWPIALFLPRMPKGAAPAH
jgi:hypothetical protein